MNRNDFPLTLTLSNSVGERERQSHVALCSSARPANPALIFAQRLSTILPLPGYVFSVVETLRCDVRAACSGATPSNAGAHRSSVPPATARAGAAEGAGPPLSPQNNLSPRYWAGGDGAARRPYHCAKHMRPLWDQQLFNAGG